MKIEKGKWKMDTKTEINKYTIIIIQSLKDNDLKTGEMLYDSLSTTLPVKYPDTSVKFYNVKDKQELAITFFKIYNEIENGELVTLQIETHGCEEGIELISGELMTWKEFFGSIRPINVKMLNLLLVCMSMCYGGALIKQFEPEKRAPYRAFIGAGSRIKAGVLLDGFSAFYENYHNLLDSLVAYEAMKAVTIDEDKNISPFWFMTSEEVFRQTLDPDRDPENFKHLVNDHFVAQKVKGKDVTLKQVENEIRKLLTDTYNRCYDYYNFRDLIPKE